ncbi:type IV pilus assembly protein PilC [Sporomusaceae bacterium BoRhaA]|uniref:type II secretion system F family protein n=1 Tax=Pelorhabdus rhamnosifermentans TaxID=2772457 RepID=UPI001C05F508|nr:type II secretion system F family protein [Pelorhabdus rhamnosifermentans]MBU2703050.1 type IV pilus assembly protein PilC [Pelorhabdus rhamnosifermentans]
MSTKFLYRARDAQGLVITGQVIAETQGAAAGTVRAKGYYVTKIVTEKKFIIVDSLLKNYHKVGLKELALFCRQFSTMINAGLSLMTSLQILMEQSQNEKLKTALAAIYQSVQEGESLSRSMALHDRIFPIIMTTMVEVGEVGGVLDQVLARLAVQFDKEYKLNEKIKSAMVYPVVVLTMAGLSVTFILTFVLPTFMRMFDEMHMELPILTKVLLVFSNFLYHDGVAVLLGFFMGAILLRIFLDIPQIHLFFDEWMMKIPVFGSLWRKVAIARFTRTLSTLLKGGVPLITALEVAKKTVHHASMLRALSDAQVGIRDGVSLSRTLRASKVFMAMEVEMVAVGEETGALDSLLEKVADFYDSDVEDMTNRLSTLLEPLIIGVIGVVIGMTVLAIMIPMLDVITGMGSIH